MLGIWKISKIPENLGNSYFLQKYIIAVGSCRVCLARLVTLNALQCTGNDALRCTGNDVLQFTGNDALQCTGNDALQCTGNVGSEISKIIYCLQMRVYIFKDQRRHLRVLLSFTQETTFSIHWSSSRDFTVLYLGNDIFCTLELIKRK